MISVEQCCQLSFICILLVHQKADRFMQESKSVLHCAKKATFHQVTTMLATSQNVLFVDHNPHANHRY